MIFSDQVKENRCKAWIFIVESSDTNIPVSEEFKEMAVKEVNGEIEAHVMLDYVKDYILKNTK